MIPTLGFNHLSRVGVFEDLHLTRFSSIFGRQDCYYCTSAGVENLNYVAQAVTIFSQQRTQLSFKFDFLLQRAVIFQAFQLGQLRRKLLLKGTKFSEFRHENNLQ
ncbi:hypothetical protein BGP81_00105 [Pseudomonas putida]|nr:hypothetical protein BGP81_00105 [Pseudomonas putida]